MDDYSTYARYVEGLVRQLAAQGVSLAASEVAAVLDGEPNRMLRGCVPIETLRSTGAFFSSRGLANIVADLAHETAGAASVFFDPACGAGELLLACARKLGVGSDLSLTLGRWADQLLGLDLHAEFVRVCRARLVLEAMSRCGNTDLESPSGAVSNIQVRDALTCPSLPSNCSHVVMNPPFTAVPIPDRFKWATGKVSLAAVFLSHCLEQADSGVHIVAVLPEVLRTGERYKRWRADVERQSSIRRVQRYGIFDKATDVDVFLIALEVGGSGRESAWCRRTARGGCTVEDHFDVSVGPVVPYRDKQVGVRAPFLNARSATRWGIVENLRTFRRYSGRLHRPPFVVIRRTSRPDDEHRAVGSIVRGHAPVAVENHLLVARPKDGRVATCEVLLGMLRRRETTQWFNERIRCRHLTVAAVKELPWLR